MAAAGYAFRRPFHHPEARGGSLPRPRTEHLPDMVIDRDVAVPTSSSATIRVDVYRPEGGEPAAPLISWSPYGKHITEQLGVVRPASGVASWSDQGLHSRGTLEGFRRISSERKWLHVHGRKKWAEYYRPENVERQRAFFDHFLLGRDTELDKWPPVRVEVRDSYYAGRNYDAGSWPLPQVHHRPLYLNAATATLDDAAPEVEQTAGYDGLGSGLRPHRLEFQRIFDRDIMLVGHMKARLYMSAPEAADMDVFVAVFKRDGNGDVVGFPYYAIFDDGPVAAGWQRASHRELDPARSTPYHPVLAHRRELPLPDDQPVKLEIEILPSGTRFAAGEALVLVVQGSDVMRYPKPALYARHEESVNRGPHVVHAGGQYDSHLLIPVFGDER